MMRRILFLFLLALTAPLSWAADAVAVKIKQVGLEGVHKQNGGAIWVQASLRNSTSQPLSFSVFIAELNLAAGALPMAETFLLPMTLAPSEERIVDVPLPVYYDKHAVIYAEARDARGWSLGSTGQRVTGDTDGQIVAMICTTPELCGEIRKTILISGSPDEQTHKSQTLRLVQLLDPPSHDWAYPEDSIVIVAAPVARLSDRQREALHLFMLRGGRVLLVDDQLGDAPPGKPQMRDATGSPNDSSPAQFLGAYRRQYPAGGIHTVANGGFAHFPSVSAQSFADFLRPLGFSASTPEDLRVRFAAGILRGAGSAEEMEARWLEKRLGTSFRFPSFAEILTWMIGYILLVGVVNFFILRRIGRPEWAWITVPLLALVVSTLLYLSSERNRPRNFGVDEMAVYRMDSLSPETTAVARLRVSAPSRSIVTPQLPAQWTRVVPNRQGFEGDGPTFAAAPVLSGGEVRIGKFWEAEFLLRRWSFADLNFRSHRLFSGRIYRDSAGRFHNESGVSFGQAILVDHEDVFTLGYFPAGAVVDLAHVVRRPYSSESGRNVVGYPNEPFAVHPTKQDERFGFSLEQSEREWNALEQGPFSLAELIRGWSVNGDDVFADTKAAFFGLTEQAPVAATLRDRSPDHKSASLVVVTFGEWP